MAIDYEQFFPHGLELATATSYLHQRILNSNTKEEEQYFCRLCKDTLEYSFTSGLKAMLKKSAGLHKKKLFSESLGKNIIHEIMAAGKANQRKHHILSAFLQQNLWIRLDNGLYNYCDGFWKSASFNDFIHVFTSFLEPSLECSFNLNDYRELYNLLNTNPAIYQPTSKFGKGRERYVCFANGTYDLEEQKLTEHNPKHECTTRINAEYDDFAKGYAFDKYLETISIGDKYLEERILEFLGYCLSDSIRAKAIFLLLGPGNTGKTTFTKIIQMLIGEENQLAFNLAELGKTPWTTGSMFGKKIAFDTDLSSEKYSEGAAKLLKQISGGDIIKGELKGVNMFTYQPTCKIVLASNFIPTFGNDDPALASRWVKLPFLHQLNDNEMDIELLDKLSRERSYIIKRAIEALVRLMQNEYRFTPLSDDLEAYEPEALKGKRKTKAYASVFDFLTCCCDITGSKTDTITTERLYFAYCNFCDNSYLYSENKLSKTIFSKAVNTDSDRICHAAGHNKQRSLQGIRLKNQLK